MINKAIRNPLWGPVTSDMPQPAKKCLPNTHTDLVSIPSSAPTGAWWHIAVVVFLRRWRQENQKVKVTLGYATSSRLRKERNPLHSGVRNKWEGRMRLQ